MLDKPKKCEMKWKIKRIKKFEKDNVEVTSCY